MGRRERTDQMVRFGLQLWANQEEKEKNRAEIKSIREEEARRYGVQEKRREAQEGRQALLGERQETEFEWKEEEHKEKKDFEVISKELEVGNALIRAGKEREGAARLVNTYNKNWQDGGEARVIFRSDAPGSKGLAQWDSDPKLAGNNLAILSSTVGLMGFKTTKDFQNYISSWVNPKEYLRVTKKSEAKVADANNRETPFVADDGEVYINTWVLGPGGNLKRGQAKRYEGKVPAQKRTGLDLKAREAEKVLGRPLTPKEKKVTLGLAEKEKKEKAPDISKQLGADKDALDLLLMRFVSKSVKKDALSELLGEEAEGEGEISLKPAGENALDRALNIVEKDEKSLTPKEKKLLPYAKKVLMLYSQISGRIAGEYAGGEPSPGGPADGKSWSAYDTTPPSPGMEGLVPAHRRPILGNQRANQGY